LLDTHNDKIIVGFDRNDRVISYQDILVPAKDPVDDMTTNPLPPQNTLPIGHIPMPPYPYDDYCLNDHDFSILYDKVRDGSFDDDKYNLIEVASLGCYYTCNQCARIMGLFSFADDKLKALRYMARHIVDPQNAYSIYRLFDFSDDKEKAAQIIQGR
jgi:oligoribonuclease (3'-5' exoribonuclease)